MRISLLKFQQTMTRDDLLNILNRNFDEIQKYNPLAKRTQVVESTSETTPYPSLVDIYKVVDLATDITINNPQGTVADGQQFTLYIQDDGTPRTLAWDTDYEDLETLPVVTSAGKLHRITFELNNGKWYCTSSLNT